MMVIKQNYFVNFKKGRKTNRMIYFKRKNDTQLYFAYKIILNFLLCYYDVLGIEFIVDCDSGEFLN